MSTVHVLASKVIQRYKLNSIRDVIDTLPAGMCHILQESKVFETYPPESSRLLFEGSQKEEADARFLMFRNEIIPNISPEEHLQNLAAENPVRKPCFCRQMADVAAIIVAQMTGRDVYVVRNIYVNYLHLPQQWHCLNATVVDGTIRYFDTSAYAQVIDPESKRILRPNKLKGFDAADIAHHFIESDGWLQSEPFGRTIRAKGDQLVDSFFPAPLEDLAPDEFLSVVKPVDESLLSNEVAA